MQAAAAVLAKHAGSYLQSLHQLQLLAGLLQPSERPFACCWLGRCGHHTTQLVATGLQGFQLCRQLSPLCLWTAQQQVSRAGGISIRWAHVRQLLMFSSLVGFTSSQDKGQGQPHTAHCCCCSEATAAAPMHNVVCWQGVCSACLSHLAFSHPLLQRCCTLLPVSVEPPQLRQPVAQADQPRTSSSSILQTHSKDNQSRHRSKAN